MSRTPQFDAALAEYFAKLEFDEKGGEWRTCRWSGKKFYVRSEDIAFYKKIGVPLPTLEPEERWRTLSAYQNSYNLFHITSSFSGKQILATYPPDTPYKIYEHEAWHSDAWDPCAFGSPYRAEERFFDQFRKLQLTVPRPNLAIDSTSTASPYTNYSTHLKNCYLTFNTLGGENLQYADGCSGSRDCVDCGTCINCDTCYRCFVLNDSYRCFFCRESRNCLDSFFLFDCRSTEHCFLCTNLRNKKYCFGNEQLSREEYERRVAAINLGDWNVLREYQSRFEELIKRAHRKLDNNFRSAEVYGDWLRNCKNCYYAMYMDDAERVNYSLGLTGYRDSYDVFGGGGGELCYRLASVSTVDNYGVRFSAQADNCRDIEYSDLCRNCRHCFGCVGLDNKAFCVLNRQYGEDEYFALVDDIKTAMLSRGEYGEFFPPEHSPVPYRLSFVCSYGEGFRDFSAAARYGYDVSEPPHPTAHDIVGDVIPASALPLDVKDARDNLAENVIFDERNEKHFRFTPYELAFLRRNRIALPREHPLERLWRMRKVWPVRLVFFDRTCPQCGTAIKSVHDPATYENVLCEPCYNRTVT